MKRIIIILIFLQFSIQVFSQEFSAQQGGHCYSLEIPEYMTKTYQLNDVATLQYQNISKEAYVIVIEDAKDHLESVGMKFVDSRDFLEYFITDYKIGTDKRKVNDISEFKSNNNGHAQVELIWNEDDMDFYMLITAVETKTHFYKIMCWTSDNYTELLKNDYLTISKSLKD